MACDNSTMVRQLLNVLIGCVVMGLLVNTWLLEGLVVPIVVVSESMAPNLMGPHRHWRCIDCDNEFDCGLESLPSYGMAAMCPHCGAANDFEGGTDRAGAHVLIDRSTLAWRGPRRGEVVVLQNPDEPSTLAVK